MTTKTKDSDLPIYVGTGFEAEARSYSYAGAPAYEIYINTRADSFGPVAYYEATPEGLDVEIIDVAGIEAAAAAAYRSVYGGAPTDGVGQFELMAIRAEIFEAIESELLSECQALTPDFDPILTESVSFETDRWYITAHPDNEVYVTYTNTGVTNTDAFRLVRGADGTPEVVLAARAWVPFDSVWGVKCDAGNERRVAALLESELTALLRTAVNQWKSEGVIV